MFLKTDSHRTISDLCVDDNLQIWIEAFLIDRKVRGSAKGTLSFYHDKLRLFFNFCDDQLVKNISQISPDFIRQFLLSLELSNHNPGGIHAAYRTLRAFLFWYEDELEPEGWKNPIRKVKAPKVPKEILEPISFEVVSRLLRTCSPNTFTGTRDSALLLFFLDTGVRAQEGLSINMDDIKLPTGEVIIRQGKGKKARYVYFSKFTRKAIRKYLLHRKDDNSALWVTHPRFDSSRLSYDGLREIIKRRAKEAGIEDIPNLHDFRRAFALSMLRNGTDIFTLAKLMGHESIAVLQRYLKQTNQDVALAHRKASPVEFGFEVNNFL